MDGKLIFEHKGNSMGLNNKDKKNAIKLFEEHKVRTSWNSQEEKWYFSVIDIIAILTESKDPTAYWRKLKQRLKAEGNETVTNCHGLKMVAPDGKMRLIDIFNTEGILKFAKMQGLK